MESTTGSSLASATLTRTSWLLESECRCVTSSNRSSKSTTAVPNRARRRDSMSGDGRGRGDLATPLLPDALAGDLLLERHDALQQRLGAWRASGDVHVDGDDL